MLVKMVQLFPLTDERMRRNEEKCEDKIRPLNPFQVALLHYYKNQSSDLLL